ncbi:MAG: NUDIX hydrolase [Candidatus Paceibacterota bacterium]
MYKDRKGNHHEKPDNIESQKRESANGIYIKNGEVLLVKPSWVDIWEFPGGGKELNENLIDTLKREFLEETGSEVLKLEENPIYQIQTKFYADDLDIFFDSSMSFFKILEIGEQNDTLIHKDEIIDIKYLPIYDLNKENMNNLHLEIISILDIQKN